jgi:hypothetical protein
MKKSTTEKFERKTSKVLIPIGLAVAGVLANFVVGSDTTSAATKPSKSIEIGKPITTPNGWVMSEIGKVVLANGKYSETIYVCVQKLPNNEDFLADRVILNAPKRIDSEFATGMIDRSNKTTKAKNLGNISNLNVWGNGNNTANATSQQMTIDSKIDNFVTFYGSWNGPNSTEGDGAALRPIQVPNKQLPNC